MNTNDRYAVMLLTMALSANKEEYARPYSTQEYYQLIRNLRGTRFRSVGELMNMDISGYMMYLNISEEEAFRLYTLLNRTVPLSYAIENLLTRNVSIVTLYDADYPERIRMRMKDAAPPFLYRAGDASLLERKMFGVFGIPGVKTTQELRDGLTSLVERACANGYVIVTGGEMGVARVAEAAVHACGGSLVNVLAGGLYEHLDATDAEHDGLQRAVLTMEHPESMVTVTHAITRNKLMFSLCDAALVCNTDNKRGEVDALNNKSCDWIYAWRGYPANAALIAKGAIPMDDPGSFPLEEKMARWDNSGSVQLDIFSMLGD